MSFLSSKRKSSSQQLGETVAALYHYSQDASLVDFKKNCYQELSKVVDLGESYWLIDDSELCNESDSARVIFSGKNLDAELRAVLEQYQQPASSKISALSVQPLQLHHSAVACQNHLAQAGVSHRFLFTPKEPTSIFSETDLQRLNMLLPHLLEAFRLNVLSRIKAEHYDSTLSCALCEADGTIIRMDEDFANLMEAVQTDWNRLRLPFPLAQKTEFILIDDIAVHCTRTLDVFSLQATRLTGCRNRLTLKELEVCFYLKQAFSNQAIAQAMGVSRKTIENHLGNIYRKLGQIRRSELFVLLHGNK